MPSAQQPLGVVPGDPAKTTVASRMPTGEEISSAKAPVYVTLLKKEEAKLFKQSYTKCHQMNEEHMHIMEDRGGEPNMWEWSTVSASIRSSH
ncbi:uncharacterized protein LOC144589050 isoform X3 [Pogona vitticeps]